MDWRIAPGAVFPDGDAGSGRFFTISGPVSTLGASPPPGEGTTGMLGLRACRRNAAAEILPDPEAAGSE